MRPDPAAYEDVFGSLADGTPIDWTTLEAGARDEQAQRRYRNLRLVARVAELHRTLTLDEDPPAPLDGLASAGGEPPRVWGRLEVGERLASGAFGDLYRARDPQLERDVALKLLRSRPGDAASIAQLSEAQTLAKVSHPNVVIVHGADVADGRAGLWMELIDGQTLAVLAHERGKHGAGETTSIGRDICRALAAVHGAGLVHGDVKAQNVMREAGGRIVLMDFGAGRKSGAAWAAAGTPLYLAPEVLAGGPPTPQSDLYSLGVLLFFLLTGRYPYRADDLEGLRRAHADDARVYLRDERPDLPDPVVDCVERALERDPALRFATAGAMERALSGAQAPPRVWWRPVVIATFVAAVVVAGLATFWPHTSVPSAPRSLAVLTFASPDTEAAHLISGLNADLIRELQRFDVQVRTVAGAGAAGALPDLETRLGVEVIVAASAHRKQSGTSLMVAVHRPSTAPFWTRNYDVPNAGLPSLATTIAQDVAGATGIQVRTGAPLLYQPNARANEAYHKGRLLAGRRGKTDLTQSIQYFRQAADLDPRYAEPWVGMADVYLTLGTPPFGNLRPREARVNARQMLEKALAINPNLAEAETSLAWAAASYDWDWAGAEARFQRAIDLNPQYALAHHWYSMLLTDLGRFDDARAELLRAQSLEPLSLLIHRDFGWIYFMEGRFDDAVRQLRQTLTLDAKDTPALTLLARSLAAKRDFSGAAIELEKARPDITPGTYLGFRGYFEAAAGNPSALQTLANLNDEATREYITPYYFALIYAALGRRDAAIVELERSYAEQDSTLTSINVDPRFESLRTDARFQTIIKNMRLPVLRR